MSTINYYLDSRSIRKNGTSPLKVVINTSKGNFMVQTGIYMAPKQWNSNLRMVTKNHPRNVFLNTYLSDMMAQVETALLEEQRRLNHALNAEQIKSVIMPLFVSENKNESKLKKVFDSFINSERLKKRTRELYAVTLKKIDAFTKNKMASLQFEDINVRWLEKFDEWLANDCPAANARAIHMRNLRAVFNAAIDDEITTNYPFRKFKIVREATRKRALTVQQLRMLMKTDLKPYQKRYVDTFILMFYLIGINAVDLLNAKPNQIVNGRLEYKRSKTGALYSIKIEPEAMEIIKRYKGKKHLLKFCDTATNYKNYLKRMNMCLNELIPGCSTYYARHTSATIAAEIDIPVDTIARMLGHTDPTRKITLVYIDFNRDKIDEANRKVLDWVLYEKKDDVTPEVKTKKQKEYTK